MELILSFISSLYVSLMAGHLWDGTVSVAPFSACALLNLCYTFEQKSGLNSALSTIYNTKKA